MLDGIWHARWERLILVWPWNVDGDFVGSGRLRCRRTDHLGDAVCRVARRRRLKSQGPCCHAHHPILIVNVIPSADSSRFKICHDFSKLETVPCLLVELLYSGNVSPLALVRMATCWICTMSRARCATRRSGELGHDAWNLRPTGRDAAKGNWLEYMTDN